MGNNFVWLPRRLLQLTVTSSVNRAQREIYTFFRILIKWHHLSQSAARTPSVCRSLLSVACLHIAIFSARDSRDERIWNAPFSNCGAHAAKGFPYTHAHTSVLAAIVSTLDALRDWSSVCISITERDNWSRAPIEIYMCSPRLPIPRLPYNHRVYPTQPYPTLPYPCPTLANPTLLNSCPVVSALSL